ncbi:MAG TPA: protein-L-isoaspartate(D-aspartate) O-methyltransferase [Verrucomicrobiae bacterium]
MIALRAILLATALAVPARSASGGISRVIHEVTSPYHHIRVLDDGNFRTLCFDDALETSMSIQNPLTGHYEYTEYFHMPWLWNTNISKVLIIGLGGGSAQRSFEHYYPRVTVDSVEIDPTVLQIANDYFNFRESERQKVHLEDGRVYLRRSTAQYDLIVLDAYVQGRYGSCLPQHLATQEFFQIARDHLTTNGIVAYNVIGNVTGWHAEIVGAIYRTLTTVFPQVYLFRCNTSQNIVLIATKARGRAEINGLRQRAHLLVQSGRIELPGFLDRLSSIQFAPPANLARCPILTDDFAPVEGLAGGGGKTESSRSRANSPAGSALPPVDSRLRVETDPFATPRARMVTDQLAPPGRGITNAQVLHAMGKVPRQEFIPAQLRSQAYQDSPLPIGFNQTISQPYIVAFMTEQLRPRPTDRVLEIGTGSGYQAAILSELVAQVYTIEIVPELARRAAADLSRLGYTNVFPRAGDGYNGWPEASPFDAIIVTCAPDKVPQPLVEQLKEGGRMIIPIGSGFDQQLVLLTKRAGILERRAMLPVRFVPMTRALKP